MKNLVIALAQNCCDWNSIEPFATSFKKNVTNADLILFVGDISKFSESKLRQALDGGGGTTLSLS